MRVQSQVSGGELVEMTCIELRESLLATECGVDAFFVSLFFQEALVVQLNRTLKFLTPKTKLSCL